MASTKDSSLLNANEGSVEAKAQSDTSEARDEELGTSSKSDGEVVQTGASDSDQVDWDGPDDLHNPRNWSGKAKILNCLTIILLTLLTPLASSMFAPGVPDVLRDFDCRSESLAEFVVSIYVLGYAVGPLLIGPASETYGRYRVYVFCNILFLVFTIACAVAQSMSQLIVFRFFAGCFGVCPITLGGASIADLIVQEKRGAAISLYSMGPLMGPVIGPVAGSYLAAAEGWRWTFWVIAIAFGICMFVHAAVCRETHHPTLLARKTKRLQKETGNTALRSKLDDGLSTQQRVSRAMIRPLKMLLFSPMIFLMALYCAIVYGILYLLYTTFTFVFEEYYHISASNVGLTYIGSGIGMFIGTFIIGGSSDVLLKKLAAKHGGELKPEYRLIPLMCTGWLCPVGLFIYGWTAQNRIQWAAPLFGTLLFGIGILGALICIQQYLIDAYTQYAASTIAANTVFRSIVGGLLPLAGLRMYSALSLGWGNTILGFVALAMVPVPFVFYFFGERIRKRFPLKL